ncbi:type II toxin-antitoxin system death-on-curing family toxin [Salmonella enterica]|nr:type II toxin-antitoxin system death-on-curing family toxin [Salmonella enterica]EJF7575698.1 type II toxin-antitoxin system death-on-curing family toxin [Salmonella enterica subsp. enterica]HAV7961500.1 type II toxin-antitoxin system death-on-curing family toxin [Escherichia coli]
MISFLSSAEVIQIHEQILSRTPGLAGCNEPGRVDAICDRVLNYHLYESVNDIYALGAMYLTSISRGHVFNDANKRTAFTCAMLFLRRNGVVIKPCAELVELTVKVAAGEISLSGIIEELKKQTI